SPFTKRLRWERRLSGRAAGPPPWRWETNLRFKSENAHVSPHHGAPDSSVVRWDCGQPRRDNEEGQTEAATGLRARPEISASSLGVEAPGWQGARSAHSGTM